MVVVFDDVALLEFMYFVQTRMPGEITVCDSGLSCYVPCLSIAIYFPLFVDYRPEQLELGGGA